MTNPTPTHGKREEKTGTCKICKRSLPPCREYDDAGNICSWYECEWCPKDTNNVPKPDTSQEKCESCACKNYFDKAKPECYCECHSTKNDSRREGWGNFTISPKDCGMDYAPETKFKDQIIRMLDRDTRDKLLPDICREKAKYFLSIFREVQSQLTTLKEQNAELVAEKKELHSALYDAARAVGIEGVVEGVIGSDGIELSYEDFVERGKENAELVSKVKVAEEAMKEMDEWFESLKQEQDEKTMHGFKEACENWNTTWEAEKSFDMTKIKKALAFIRNSPSSL